MADTIYEILGTSPKSVAQLIEATQRKDNYVRACLGQLVDAGKIRCSTTVRAKRMGPPTHLWERIA